MITKDGICDTKYTTLFINTIRVTFFDISLNSSPFFLFLSFPCVYTFKSVQLFKATVSAVIIMKTFFGFSTSPKRTPFAYFTTTVLVDICSCRKPTVSSETGQTVYLLSCHPLRNICNFRHFIECCDGCEFLVSLWDA